MNKLDNIKANLFQRDFSIDKPLIDKATRKDWVRFGYDNIYTQL